IALLSTLPAAADPPAVLEGTVRTPVGKPLPEALVTVNRCSGAKVANFTDLQATTDTDGRYRITIRQDGPGDLVLHEIWASAEGRVRYDYTEPTPAPPGAIATVDFILFPGDELRGVVDIPLTATEQAVGLAEKQRTFLLRVSNSGFEQIFRTEPGGGFRIFVPKGTYDLAAVGTAASLVQVETPQRHLRVAPQQDALTPAGYADAFDRLWTAMDRHYSYFALKPDVDWAAAKTRFRPQAAAATSPAEFVAAIKPMLAELHDMHVWIDGPAGALQETCSIPWHRNWNPQVVSAALTDPVTCGDFATVARTQSDGFGCVVVLRQSAATPESVAETVAAIRRLGDVPGFIVDLRGGCNGGNEGICRPLASAFCAQERVYAKQRYRIEGPNHALGPAMSRTLPAGETPFTKPVVCLIGHKCMSSGEALVLMFASLPQVTTVGATTRGSSGNPKPVELPELHLAVHFSRWEALTPDDKPFEGTGIAPDVPVDAPPAAYDSGDPTWTKGLEILREKVKAAKAN
ncbi:MAG TPA: S41 family peptidase, partial [Phycisphaerae bacterium]|nr:S41 family peptidase [Phycisphaerae bacterium]